MTNETNPDNGAKQPIHPPRSLKIEDSVYQDLDTFKLHRETFSQAIGRLLKIARGVSRLYNDSQIPGSVSITDPGIWNNLARHRSDPAKQPEHQVTEPAAAGR